MSITLITGNGFDLHFGLPTRYADFIQITKNVIEGNKYSVENVYGNVLKKGEKPENDKSNQIYL